MNRRRRSFSGREIRGERREPLDRWNAARPWSLASNFGARSVVEHAVDGADPRPHRPEAHRVRTGRVRRRHAADRTKSSARRVHRKPQAMPACGRIHLGAQRARSCAHDPRCYVDTRDVAPSAEVHDDPLTDRAARHAAARTPRDQRQRALFRPTREEREVVDVARNGDGHRNAAGDAGRLSVDVTRVVVASEDSAESVRCVGHFEAVSGHRSPVSGSYQ